jgi:hypothetical protein
MKKSIFIAVLGVTSVIASYGQGTVLFKNYVSSTQTFGVSYANGPAAGQYVGPEISAELLYGASTATTIGQLTPLASSIIPFGLGAATGPGAIGTGAGWFDAGSPQVPGTPGATYAFAVEFTGNYQGVTYTGFTSIFTGSTQSGTGPIPFLPAGLLQNFTVSGAPVPEPTTLALVGLGSLASLVALRRKQV